MKRTLVIGGAGFIGSNLCKRLHSLGHNVTSLDNYFTGTVENHHSGVRYINGRSKDINKIFVNESFDLIYHLGEYSRVEKSFEDPIRLVWDLNIAGTFAVLEFVKKTNAKLVYAGSSTKFASDGNGGNMSPYAWSKSSNTQLVKNFGDWYGIKYAITYFYNVSGDGEISSGPYATVLGIFKKQYENGYPITLVRPGDQRRNFTHIDDIVDALILVGEKGEGDEYGIGSDESFSVREIAEFFSTEIILMPERKGNRSGALVVSEKTKALGWVPRRSVKDHIVNWKNNTDKRLLVRKKERKVLVFTTTFYPKMGVSEQALFELAKNITDIEFHVITTNIIDTENKEDLPANIKVFRIGNSSSGDKISLLRNGFERAKELSMENSYSFVWSIMASYGTYPAFKIKKYLEIPLLISLGDQLIPGKFSLRYWIFRFFVTSSDLISTNAVIEENVSNGTNLNWLNSINKKGDSFLNAFSFAYNAIFNRLK